MASAYVTKEDEVFIDLECTSPQEVHYSFCPEYPQRTDAPKRKVHKDYASPRRMKRERATRLYKHIDPTGREVLSPHYYPSHGYSWPKDENGQSLQEEVIQSLQEYEETVYFPFHITKSKTYFCEPGQQTVQSARGPNGEEVLTFNNTTDCHSNWLEQHLKLEIKI